MTSVECLKPVIEHQMSPTGFRKIPLYAQRQTNFIYKHFQTCLQIEEPIHQEYCSVAAADLSEYLRRLPQAFHHPWIQTSSPTVYAAAECYSSEHMPGLRRLKNKFILTVKSIQGL